MSSHTLSAALTRYLSAVSHSDTHDHSREHDLHPAGQFVTISRQAGVDAVLIGERVAKTLNEQLASDAPEDVPWTVFDKNLVDVVLKMHSLPSELARYMPEDRRSAVADMLGNALGKHPPSATLVQNTNRTILALARMGKAILIGRGAVFLTRQLGSGFHVRLIGLEEHRIRRFAESNELDERSAATEVNARDEARRRYVRDHLGEDVDDLFAHDCVINTTWVTNEAVAGIISGHVGRLVSR